MALSSIDVIDAVLIDGDHNWYTVYNELKQIEGRCEERSKPFPLVMLHDVGWPYGRRDLYYDPENIPEEYRKSHIQKGLHPDSEESLEKGGLNTHLFNAALENEPRSGVLTAVEDFMNESGQRLGLIKLPGINGLGILYTRDLEERNRTLAEFLETLNLPDSAVRLLDLVERDRLETAIGRQEARRKVKRLEARNQKTQEQLRTREEDLENLRRQLHTKQKTVEELQEHSRRALSLLSDHEHHVKTLRSKMNHRSKEIERLSRWCRQMSWGVTRILNSREWKTGVRLTKLIRRALRKPYDPPVPEDLVRARERFSAWLEHYDEVMSRADISRDTSTGSPQPLEPVREDTPVEVAHETLLNSRSVDIVVCVHNALDDVKTCLASVTRNTPQEVKLYLVNDGSDEPTTECLREFTSRHPSCVLLENSEAQGYTRAANQGLRATTAEYVVLLNSDTIVTQGWLQRLLECGESDPRIGIIGPLSNAASWQSVPLLQAGGDWATNPLPDGYSVDDVAEVVSSSSCKVFPRVPFINGFCFVVKRSLMDTIGYLDEEMFPEGYGEENDYCLRAADAGFELAVADHAYVFHAKSRSYSHERRHLLRKPGGAALKERYGAERISQGTQILRSEPALREMREKVRLRLEISPVESNEIRGSSFKVLFLLPGSGGGGGAHSVVQEAQGMLELGVSIQVAVPMMYRSQYLKSYPGVEENLFYFFQSEEELVQHASNFGIVVATHFTSVKLLKSIHDTVTDILPAYYIQDYEPWFVPAGSKLHREALDSYSSIPSMILFAKTDWLRGTITQYHDVKVEKVSPSLDHSLYYPLFDTGAKGTAPITVTAMVRPQTPRRAAADTMRVLRNVKNELEERVRVTIFGCESDDPLFLNLPRNFAFDNRGTLMREGVAELLRETDIFVDASVYQAFGRTGLEAMACGCATVLPGNCGTGEYAVDRENALLVDTSDFKEPARAVKNLVNDEDLRRGLSRAAVMTAAKYSLRRAAISELTMLRQELQKRIHAGEKTSSLDSVE